MVCCVDDVDIYYLVHHHNFFPNKSISFNIYHSGRRHLYDYKEVHLSLIVIGDIVLRIENLLP